MHVVATAGHVDHGKSTLVRALTGQDPDRLEEEHRRGLSIRLGYCWTELDGVGEVAFVDVPGHERFIATTLAGLGPAHVVLLVVAADDPWMPQAAEHLAALDALGVRRGVLVVTRADLADPQPALARARAEVDRTSLAGIPDVVVSAATGRGLDELRSVLTEALLDVPVPPSEAPVRLWVDRRFHVKGTGTVVTGTLAAGTIAPGDRLVVDGGDVRVRGTESLGRRRDRVTGPARVALDLGGHAPEAVTHECALVTADAWEPTTLVDVEVRGDAADLPRQPMLHLGSLSVAVHARPLGDRFVRLGLDRPVPVHVGDAALLRDPGSRRLWGVRVLDPAPPELRRRGAGVRRAEALASLDGSLAADLALRGTTRRSEARRRGLTGEPAPGTVEAAGWLLSPDRAVAARSDLEQLVRDRPPVAPPLSRDAVADALRLPDPALVAALVIPPLVERAGTVVLDEQPALDPALQGALEEVRAVLLATPYAPPDRTRLRELGLDARALGHLARAGALLRLPEDVVLLPGADDDAVSVLAALEQPFTTSAARTALGTSRRVALALLDHLDRTGRTVRLPDDTRRVRLSAP